MITVKMRRRVDILLADDGSPSALAAIRLLKDLPISRSALPKSSITVVEVIDPLESYDAVLRAAELEQAKALLEGSPLDVKTGIKMGNPARVLVECARRQRPDLILIGARGRRAGLSLELGNVAQQVVEEVDCPVLVVRTPYHGLKQILLAVDGSGNSLKAARYLSKFPLPLQASVEVLTVLPRQPAYADLSTVWIMTYPLCPVAYQPRFQVDEVEIWKVEEEEGQVCLDRTIDVLRAGGVKATGLILQGEAAPEIMAFSRARRMDLIRSRGGVRGQVKAGFWAVSQTAHTCCGVFDSGRKGISETAKPLKHKGFSMTAACRVRRGRGSFKPMMEEDHEYVNNKQPMKIVLADDGSQHALAAAALVRDLPLPAGSQVTVVGVLPPGQGENYAVMEADLNQTRVSFEERLIEVETELLSGHPSERLIEYADEHCPDLVVMGAKGQRATLGILLGGVAQQVVEYAHWPVLVVRAPYEGLRQVLLVTDGSMHSRRATEYLAHFPLPHGVEVHALHILPPMLEEELALAGSRMAAVRSGYGQEKPAWQVQEECEGQAILDGAVKTLTAAGLPAQGVLWRGDAATEMISYIRAKAIDLVVVGSRGLTPATQWLLGSVSRKLIHYSGCSVLLVRGGPVTGLA
jgi:nucleotide-binding universal stress UspA family protein